MQHLPVRMMCDGLRVLVLSEMPHIHVRIMHRGRALLIGVGIGSHRPRPPNRTGGFPAYGSPVGGFFIETVSLFARPCEARTTRLPRSRHLASVGDRRSYARRPVASPVCAGAREGGDG